MLRIALIYGFISGAIVITTIAIGISNAEPDQMTGNQTIGYLIMLIALSSIFLAIKTYRDNHLGGVIKFWRAVGLGFAITIVAGATYTIGWEIFLASTGYDFMEVYIAASLEARREAGASEAEIEALATQMQSMATLYDNAVFRLPMTFFEIFPVGILVALVSAAILRNPKVLPARQAR